MRTRKTVGILTVGAIMVLGYFALALADENSWSTGGPYDASVWSIAVHPFDTQRLYIGTLESFVFQTTDGGAEWSMIEDTLDGRLESRNLRGLKIHPFGPDTLFAVTYRGVYRSRDSGQSWSQIFPLWPEIAWDALEVSSRSYAPVVYIGTWGSAWRSTNGGESWEQMEIVEGFNEGAIQPIVADPVDPDIVYAGNNTTVPDETIFKSTDSGVTWFNIDNNLEYGAPDHVYTAAIAVDPIDHTIVYFARSTWGISEEVLVKSTDGGGYWMDITPPGLNEYRLTDVTVSPIDHNMVFVCTESDGVLRSADGGETWEQINEDLIGRRPLTAVIDYGTGFLYLGMYAGGIYRSTDNGDSWEKISYNITAARCSDIAANWRSCDTLYTATRNGVYISIDGAASWEHIDLNFPHYYPRTGRVEVDPYDPSYIYVSYYGMSGGPYSGALYRSTDGGATWWSFTEGLLPGRSYTEIAVADNGGGVRRLFMGSDQGLFYSDNLGESWSLCTGGLPPDIECRGLDVSSVIPDLVFVGDYSCNLYKSTDGGESWGPLRNFSDGDNIREIACDPVDPDVVYVVVGWDAGLFKSTDGGQTWGEMNNNLPRTPGGDYWISGIAINPQNNDNLYVNSYCRGIFVSDNGGESWNYFNEGLQTIYSRGSTLICPTDPRRIFLATAQRSVWEITMTGGGGECVYTPGDCNHNGTALELPDVIAMIGLYRGTVEPYYTCDCPPHGDTFAPEADPNGNCITLELADVVTEIGAYRGTAEAAGCPDCPGSLRLMPGADGDLMAVPSLSTKVKSKAGSITR